MTRTTKGFTLIELVSVIVILGIIAAVAVPRFINLQTNARQATLSGMLGAVNSAMALAHAQALVQNQTGATGSITMEGQTVSLVYGYPSAASGGINNAIQFNATDFTFTGGATATFALTQAPTPANCAVTYTPATATAAASATTTGTNACN